MTASREVCVAELRPVGPHEAQGELLGFPGTPMVRTVRTGDALTVEIRSDGRTIGRGSLALDPIAEPSRWSGEIEISGCRWWAVSARGSGIVTLSSPRRPFRGQA